MDGAAAAELRTTLRSASGALEVGDWRRAFDLLGVRSAFLGGAESLTRWVVALDRTARAMQLRAHGHPVEAFDLLGIAAVQLPPHRRYPGPTPNRALALLMREPDDPDSDEYLSWRIARLLWREQFELGRLRTDVAPERTKARDVLVEAYIEHLCCVEFDPFAWPADGRTPPDDGVPLEPTRRTICVRATRLRQFADPAKGEVTQSVWQDIGTHRGLRGAALTRLASRAAPAPWCGERGTSGLKVCRGRLRAWKYAHTWRADLDYWKRSEKVT